MTIIHVDLCTNCGSENIVKNGKRPNGQQKYHCKACAAYRTINPIVKYPEEKKEEILRAYQERSSMRGIRRIYGVSLPTFSNWLKKSTKSVNN